MQDIIFLAIMSSILTVTASGLALIAWRRSRRDYRKPFALLMLAQPLMAWGYLLDVSSPDLASKLLWNDLEYVGYLAAVVLFLLFIYAFCYNRTMGRKVVAAISAPAVVLFLLVATNPYHGLFYTSTEVSADFYRSFHAVYGPAFYAYVVYALTLLSAGMAILANHYRTISKGHRYRVGVIGMAGGLSVLVVILNFVKIYDLPGCLFVTFGLLVSDVLLFIGTFGFELFSMVPYAMDSAMRTMKGMLVVLDDRNIVMFHSPSVDSLTEGRQIDDMTIEKAFPQLPQDKLLSSDPSLEEEMVEMLPGQFFMVKVALVRDFDEYIIGRNITMREVTAQVLAEADARSAHEMLDLMNRITRHDVINQLTILEGHTSLAIIRCEDPEVRRHLDSMSKAVHTIQKQMEFARYYQDMGARKPEWQNVSSLLYTLERTLDLKGAKVFQAINGVELYADPLLEKVFYNLLDNSVEHGGKVTRMNVSMQEREDGLDIIYQDDGQGIPDAYREHLFSKGCGRRTGLGMFLSREILQHSGMTIIEAGEKGRGVRFIIGVPKGKYRYSCMSAEPAVASGLGSTAPGPLNAK